MRLRTPLDRWSASLLAAFGVVPNLSCGGRSVAVDVAHSGGSSGDSASSGASAGAPSGAPEGGSSGGVLPDGASSSGSSSGQASSGTTFPCTSPRPYVQGTDTGFELCDTGFVHRSAIHACQKPAPAAGACNGPFIDGGFSGCGNAGDCTARPNGSCLGFDPSGGLPRGCQCYYGCASDADCPSGQICLCGAAINQCIPASCASDADCAAGQLCTMSAPPGTCPTGAPFACQTPADTCGGNADCATTPGRFDACQYANARHQCQPSCVFGRPFLVDGAAHTAGMEARDDWQARAVEANIEDLGPAQREALGREWARMGAMEHASIGAFARFALQLLSIGAPASLLERTHEAMKDETEHAKLCFALASRYAGRPVGPGALAVRGALSDLGREAILRTTLLEGCIGETVAAVEAEEALAHAQDPAVRAALSKIAADEKRHAELAWQYVRWATQNDQALREMALSLFASEVAEAAACTPAAGSDPEGALLPFGVVPESLRREIRVRVLLDVVAPCAKALLGAPHSVPRRAREPYADGFETVRSSAPRELDGRAASV